MPLENAMSAGLYVTDTGIYQKTEEGAQIVTEMSFGDVVMLVDAVSKKQLGFECNIAVEGKPRGRRELRAETLVSKNSFQRFCAEHMTGFKGTDNHVAALMSVLRRTAEVNNNVVYLLHREGLDVVQRPDTDEDIEDLVWVSPEGIVTKKDCPTRYVFRGDTSTDGLYKSDLMHAPKFVKSDEAAEVIESLCEMNEPAAMANMLGWYHWRTIHP